MSQCPVVSSCLTSLYISYTHFTSSFLSNSTIQSAVKSIPWNLHLIQPNPWHLTPWYLNSPKTVFSTLIWFLQVSLIYTRFFVSFTSFIIPRQFNNVSKVHEESWVARRHWKLGEWLGKATYFNMLTWMKQDNSQQNQENGWISLPESFQDYLFPSALDAPSRNTSKNSNLPRGYLYHDAVRAF